MRYDPVLENALHEYRIPYPQNRASSNGFIRWGKNQRYWAIPVDDGYFFGDFVSDLSTAVFPGKEVDDFDRTRYSKRVQDLIEKMEAERTFFYKASQQRAQNIWESTPYLTFSHEYLKKKKALNYGLKVAGEGFLIIPLSDISGELWTLQFIDNHGKKRFLRNGKKSGNFFMFKRPTKHIENERKKLSADNQEAIEAIAEKEALLFEPPALPKLFLTDATTESLASALCEQGGKISIITDEGGILDTCSGLYTGGLSNIDVLLKGWDGGNLCIKRRDHEVYLSPLITIFMIVQPVIFENMAKNRNFIGKGFYERFLFCEPSSKIGYRTHQGQAVPLKLTKAYEEAVTELLKIPAPRSSAKIRLSKVACSLWAEFQNKVEKDLRKGGKMEICQGWGGKLCGQCLRLAGLLHIARYKGNSTPINGDTMRDEIKVSSCLISHATKIFDNFILSSDLRIKEASVIWATIQSFQKPVVSQREIVYAFRHKLCADQIKERLEILIERNLISEPIKVPGSKVVNYLVNPKAQRKNDDNA